MIFPDFGSDSSKCKIWLFFANPAKYGSSQILWPDLPDFYPTMFWLMTIEKQ